METLAGDFAEGKIHKDQFNAVYHHYSQQMEIVQRLVEKNPDSDAWKKAAAPGVTEFLKDEFRPEVRLCATLKLGEDQPLYIDGKVPTQTAKALYSEFKSLKLTATRGLSRHEITNGWIVVAVGELSVTGRFQRGPSMEQTRRIEDIHTYLTRQWHCAACQRTCNSLRLSAALTSR